jgi:hypothetical protein
MGGGGKRPPVEKAEKPPSVSDPAIAAALEKERMLNQKKKGRASTILNTESKPSESAASGQKTLLGE